MKRLSPGNTNYFAENGEDDFAEREIWNWVKKEEDR
jgi:hypothetical protein